MADIIKDWLQDKLGVTLDMTTFAESAQDGSLLAELLRCYEVITEDDYKKIKKTNKSAETNLKMIKRWLDIYGIRVNQSNLMQIAAKNGTAAVQVFYEIYLHFQNKQSINYITDQRLWRKGAKFCANTPNEVPSLNTLENQRTVSPENLTAPLQQAHDVVHWYKDRMDMLQSKCREARDEYLDIIKKQVNGATMQSASSHGMNDEETSSTSVLVNVTKLKKGGSSAPSMASGINIPYEELIKSQEQAKIAPPFQPNPKVCTEIMKRLKVRRDERAELDVFKNELRRELTSALWQKIEGDPEEENNLALVEIFMKQSHYEKQMLAKVGEINLQKEIMLDNKRRLDEMYNKQKEDDFVENLIQKNKEINEVKFAYYLEKERMHALHKKILQEKLRIRAEKINKICSETVRDLVDVAIKLDEYKEEYGKEPSRREMDKIKKIFTTGEQVLEELKPIEYIITQPEDIPETIIGNEIARQESLDVEEFESYMHYEWPWDLKTVTHEPQVLEDVTCGLNVLGNIVHLVLNGKYPQPPPPEIPNLPEVTIRACVNDIVDLSLLPVLQKLLKEKGIAVVQIEEAVNYCIDAFKKETKREFEELPEEEPKSPKKKEKKEKKEKPAKGTKKGSKKDKAVENLEEPTEEKPKLIDQKSQTPILFPCEVPILSNKAKLGETASEQLDEGEPLLDPLLMAMFVEYLKSFEHLKGWVLVNYPKNIQQAAFLEEAFTGINFLEHPRRFDLPEYLDDLQFRNSVTEDFEREESLRKSRLLPDPVKKITPVVYDSILTAYIKIKKYKIDEDNGESELPPVLRDIESETDPLEKFYCDMGVNYSLYYEKFDYYMIKYLAKLVIGDYTLPLKSSLELFGDTVKYIEAEATGDRELLKAAKKGEKKGQPKERMKLPKNKKGGDTSEATDEKKGKKGKDAKGKKGGKVVIVHEDKWIQVPDIEEEEEEEESTAEEIIPPTAGQEGWEYTTLPLPHQLQVALATLWENLEEIYVNDMKQILFLKRVNMDALMPFVQFVKNFMEKCINRPDYKNNFLRRFHDAFNAFDQDFRRDSEFKQEMHCRIEEFREKLLDICDRKMMGSEEQRCRIISDSWAPTQLVELLNVYVCGVQIELDRCVDSLNFAKDYYTGAVTKMPSEEFIQKEEVPKFNEVNKDEINNSLRNVKTELDMTYFIDKVQSVVKHAMSTVAKAQSVCLSVFEKVKNMLVNPKTGKGGATKDKKKQEKGEKNIMSIFEPEEIVKTNYEKILDEWHMAIKGEVSRVGLRLELLKNNALYTVEEFLNTIRQCFHTVFENLESKYKAEVQEISNACDVIKYAVEREMPIQDEILFIDDEFRINPDKILYPEPIIIPKMPEEISLDDAAFKVENLLKIADIFLDLAPSGYMSKMSFTYLLQDLIVNDPEDGTLPLVPKLWHEMEASDVVEFISNIFDDLEYVQWKEFVIHNMLVAYPTEQRLIEIRREFRVIDPDKNETIRDYQFYASEFWFENYITDKIRLKLLKQLIFKMYQIKEGVLNYTAMLLDFCKDENPLKGFVKALEVSLGRIICSRKEEGEQFKEEMLKKMREHEESVRERDEQLDDRRKLVGGMLDDIINTVVAMADGVVIEEICTPKSGTTEDNQTIFEQIEEYMKGNGVDDEEEQDYLENYDLQTVYYHPHDRFSNISIDFETTEFTKVYFLSFEPILAVITSCIPYNARAHDVEENSLRESIEEIYRSCQNAKFGNSVLAHEFLNHPRFLALLEKTKKFKALNPVGIVREVLGNKTAAS